MTEVIITGIATLFVTVLSGIILNYLSNKKAKIFYSIHKSTPMSNEDNKFIGISLIEIWSGTNQNIENTTVIIEVPISKIDRIEINVENACKVEQKTNTENQVEFYIPLLTKNDHISISLLLSCSIKWEIDCNIFFRNAKNIKIIDNDAKDKKLFAGFGGYFRVGVLSGLIVTLFLLVTNSSVLLRNQKDNLIFVSSTLGLSDYSRYVESLHNVKYFNQGDIIYTFAAQSDNDIDKEKYYNLLLTTIRYSGGMASISQSVFYYNLARIASLRGNDNLVKENITKAFKLSKKNIQERLQYDTLFSEYLKNKNIEY